MSLRATISAGADKIEAAVNKVGLELVDGWKQFYKMYSMWGYAILGASPDLYNLAVSSNLISGADAPALLVRIINLIAFFGAASRIVKQKKLDNASSQ